MVIFMNCRSNWYVAISSWVGTKIIRPFPSITTKHFGNLRHNWNQQNSSPLYLWYDNTRTMILQTNSNFGIDDTKHHLCHQLFQWLLMWLVVYCIINTKITGGWYCYILYQCYKIILSQIFRCRLKKICDLRNNYS